MPNNNPAGERAQTRVPRHIAIILDGNGRWAKKRGLPRTAGHAVGAETFRKIATYCKNIGVEYLTVYAFSTENWKRPEGEVSAIMKLLGKYLHEAIDTMERDHIRMKVFGDLEGLSPELQALVEKTDEISRRYEGFQANICLNYGGRDEILHAARRYARDYAEGRADENVSEATCIPRASPTPTCSSVRAGSSASPTSFSGSAPTPSFTSPMCSGPTSPRRSWTRPSRSSTPATDATAASNKK